MSDDRARLKALLDTRVAALVAMAAPDWPVTADHCFLRIAYDTAAGMRWDTLVARPAWRHLPIATLAAAADVLARIGAQGRPLLVTLNAASLDCRRRRQQALRA